MSEKSNKKEVAEIANQTTADDDKLVLTLADPFEYDGIEVTEICMEGLNDLDASDLCAIDMQMIAKGYSGARMEVTKQYALLVAARINKKPWEYCNKMKARDTIRLRDMVTAFFYARG